MAGNKYLAWMNGTLKEVFGIQTSAGSSSAGSIPALDSTGRLDATMMPVGIGATVVVVPLTESAAAGDFINLFENAGVPSGRLANATNDTKPAHGFVMSAVAANASAVVYVDGENTVLTGLSTGARYYLSTSPGKVTATPPSASGNIVQLVGVACNKTTVGFVQSMPVSLA